MRKEKKGGVAEGGGADGDCRRGEGADKTGSGVHAGREGCRGREGGGLANPTTVTTTPARWKWSAMMCVCESVCQTASRGLHCRAFLGCFLCNDIGFALQSASIL